jgi:hypothetical protein
VLNLIVIVILGIIAAVDLWLEITGRITISEWYQAQFPTWADLLIMCGVFTGVIFLPVAVPLKVFLGLLAGHVFWPNKERFK